MELIIKYFVGLELGVAYYIQRHFCWSSNTLWYDEIPNGADPSKALYIVGGKDDIVNGPVRLFHQSLTLITFNHKLIMVIRYLATLQRVRRYLQSHGVSQGLRYNPNGRHGQALLTSDKAFTDMLKWLREPENP